MLALMHVLLWLKDRPRRVYLLSALMAISASASALIELGLMRTDTLHTYRTLIKLENLAVFLLLVPLVWFVYAHFGTARRWLAWAITTTWGVSIIVNFLSPDSLVFSELVALEQLPTFWGEQYNTAIGSINPWVNLANAASLLIVVYVIDASIGAWQRGLRQRATVTGGSIVFFMVSAGIHTPLVDAGIVPTPYMISFWFLAIVLALSYELVSNAVQVAHYAREIQASEKRWRTLMEHVELAVIGIDNQGRINYVNPFVEKLSGYSSGNLLGHPVASLVIESDSGELARRLAQVARTSAWPKGRWQLLCASDERRQLACSMVGLRNADGTAAGLITIGEDITDRLQAQRALQRTQRELEHLTRVSLLGELAAGLAHELNQPLTAILSNAQAARRFLASGSTDLVELREILDDIIRDDKRAGEVIHRLRALLRKGGAIERARFSFADAVQEVLELLHAELVAQQVTLKVDLAPSLPDVEAGRVEIQQVVINLLLNAMHALSTIPAGKREIAIHASPSDTVLAVTVEDNGPGLERSASARLFETFYTTKREGLGMGLVICRRIVEAHGGRIWVEHTTHGGARLTFTLPLTEKRTVETGG